MQSNTFSIKRNDIDQLEAYGLKFEQSWQIADYFEKSVADFFGAPYAVATDCCTHALELCLLATGPHDYVTVPARTYMSVPMMLEKIGIKYMLTQQAWKKSYTLENTNIVDAATLWEPNSYVAGTLTCLSFHFKKHLPIGRGGMILLDNKTQYDRLQKMVRDGRDRTLLQDHDNVTELGYHYYMSPEDAARGIHLFNLLKDTAPRIWGSDEYRDLTEMDFFKSKSLIANVPVDNFPKVI